MTKAALTICLLLPLLSFAVEPDIQQQSTVATVSIRRDEIKKYVEGMIARQVTADAIFALDANGFGDHDIRAIVAGRSFQGSRDYVVNHPEIQQKIEHFLDRLEEMTSPQRVALVRAARKQDADLEAAIQMQKFLRDRQLHLDSATSRSNQTTLERIWERVRSHLLE